MAERKNHVVTVGGGAAGMMAAIVAARHKSTEVTILERNPRIGKKLLVTGNGRCNFTNIYADATCYHGENPRFVHSALAGFGVEQTLAFFEQLGIVPKVEEQGKVFPMSDQASSVLDVMRYELQTAGVKLICDAYVNKISPGKDGFRLELENGNSLQADKVILATGGKAMPATGSDGNGFVLAEALGHTLTPVFPGLVQLKLEGEYFVQLQGIKFVGTAELLRKNKVVAQDRGDILFANYGISGPPILQISRKAGELLQKDEEVVLKISLIDNISVAELEKLLLTRFKNQPTKTIEFSIVGLLNKRLIPVLLKEAGLKDLRRPVCDLSAHECAGIAKLMTDWRFKVRGTKGWSSAQVTAGGVSTNEINPQTMASKVVPGLFFAGEIMDIDGQCGGFNLQWAWSSGYLAGQHVGL